MFLGIIVGCYWSLIVWYCEKKYVFLGIFPQNKRFSQRKRRGLACKTCMYLYLLGLFVELNHFPWYSILALFLIYYKCAILKYVWTNLFKTSSKSLYKLVYPSSTGFCHGLLWVKTLRQCDSHNLWIPLAYITSSLADDDMKCADKGESWPIRWELPLPNPLSEWKHKDSVPHLWFTQLLNIFHIMWIFKKCI